jgi:uncharacterized protein
MVLSSSSAWINGVTLVLIGFLLIDSTLAQKHEGIRMTDHISNFLAAAESGAIATITESLNQGIDVNLSDKHGQTALLVASDQGHVDIVKLLLQHGASPDLQNMLGGAALMLASFNGHLEVVKELLKAGADVNAKSKHGHTSLMQATVGRNELAVQIINLLLDQKADINDQDKEGYTALMRAIDFPPIPTGPLSRRAKDRKEYDSLLRKAEIQFMIVNTLVMRGATLGLKDQRGRTALEIARMNHQTRISEFLKSR